MQHLKRTVIKGIVPQDIIRIRHAQQQSKCSEIAVLLSAQADKVHTVYAEQVMYYQNVFFIITFNIVLCGGEGYRYCTEEMSL
jgi:hypothetical protein